MKKGFGKRKGIELLPSRPKIIPQPEPPPQPAPTKTGNSSSSLDNVTLTNGNHSVTTPFPSTSKPPTPASRSRIRKTPLGSSSQYPAGIYDEVSLEFRGEELLRSLSVLVRARDLDYEKRRLGCDPAVAWNLTHSSERAAAAGHPRRVPPRPSTFEFTKEMFTSGVDNTPALLAVTHLLFETLDYEETKTRFRNCWPAHDKKQEADYRSIAFKWATELYQASPEFFVFGQPTVRVFMKPSGDQCLKFLEGFTQLALYSLCERRKDFYSESSEPLLAKFEHSDDPEVTAGQLKVLNARYQTLVHKTVATQRATMQMMVHYENQDKKRNSAMEESVKRVEAEQQMLRDVVTERRSLFPPDAEDLIAKRVAIIHEAVKATTVEIPHVEDALCSVMEGVLEDKISQAHEVYQKFIGFLNRHARLWSILQAYDENHCVKLDAAKLDWKHESSDGKLELGDFFANASNVMSSFTRKLESARDLPVDLQAAVLSQDARIKEVKERQDKILQNMPERSIEDLLRETTLEVQALSMRLEGIDWSRLSKCGEFYDGQKAFSWSPPKQEVDFTRTTGLTPALERFSSLFPSTSQNEPAPSQMQDKSTVLEQVSIVISEATVVDGKSNGSSFASEDPNNTADESSNRVVGLQTPAQAKEEFRNITQSERVNRVLNAYQLSKSPPSVTQIENTPVPAKAPAALPDRRRSILSRFLPNEPEVDMEPKSQLFGNASLLDDLDNAIGGILNESMCEFADDSLLSVSMLSNGGSSDSFLGVPNGTTS